MRDWTEKQGISNMISNKPRSEEELTCVLSLNNARREVLDNSKDNWLVGDLNWR